MPRLLGLRSPYATVAGLVAVGRTLDKIRLHACGSLPADYVPNLGDSHPDTLDGRVCRYLGVSYAALTRRALEAGCDEEVIAWARGCGHPRRPAEDSAWNRTLLTLRTNDEIHTRLLKDNRSNEVLANTDLPWFAQIDRDEERCDLGGVDKPLRSVERLIVMGVSGCGKSTTGRALAAHLGWQFLDADDYHPPANRAKMASGLALDDQDRAGWLQSLARALESTTGPGVVLACSALKARYRMILAPDLGLTRFIHLAGTLEELQARVERRTEHFMPASLLPSQLATLELPEAALTLPVTVPVATAVNRIVQVIGLTPKAV